MRYTKRFGHQAQVTTFFTTQYHLRTDSTTVYTTRNAIFALFPLPPTSLLSSQLMRRPSFSLFSPQSLLLECTLFMLGVFRHTLQEINTIEPSHCRIRIRFLACVQQSSISQRTDHNADGRCQKDSTGLLACPGSFFFAATPSL